MRSVSTGMWVLQESPGKVVDWRQMKMKVCSNCFPHYVATPQDSYRPRKYIAAKGQDNGLALGGMRPKKSHMLDVMILWVVNTARIQSGVRL